MIETDQTIPVCTPDLVLIIKKKRTCHLVYFAVRMAHRVKMKKKKKLDKYVELNRELKKLWNMKVTVIPIVVGALGIALSTVQRPGKKT